MADWGTCPVCFREFRTDPAGRLYRHVRRLGAREVCPGYKFRPAGESLDGTLWAIDRAASALAKAQAGLTAMSARPILSGIGPFDALYDSRWEEQHALLELEVVARQLDLDELTVNLAEWTPTAPWLEPVPFHQSSLWKCRAGTAVPLCLAKAPHRPTGRPTLVDDIKLVNCPDCILSVLDL